MLDDGNDGKDGGSSGLTNGSMSQEFNDGDISKVSFAYVGADAGLNAYCGVKPPEETILNFDAYTGGGA